MLSKKSCQIKYNNLLKDIESVAGKEKMFFFRGLTMGYQIVPGDFSGQKKIPLLFIHGWASTSTNWYFQVMGRILVDYDIYIVNLPGHGGLNDYCCVKDVDIQKKSDLLAEFIRKVIGVVPHIVGTSFGALIARKLTQMNMAEKTVYANPMIHGIKLPWLLGWLLGRITQKDNLLYWCVDRVVRNWITINIWVRLLGENESPFNSVCASINVVGLYKIKKNAFWGTLLNLMKEGNEDHFRNLGKREYIITSKNDITVKKGYYKSFVGHPRLIELEKGGHGTPQTMPVEFNRALRAIL